MDSFAAVASVPAGIFLIIIFSFKIIVNSNRQIRRRCADAENEFIYLFILFIYQLSLNSQQSIKDCFK